MRSIKNMGKVGDAPKSVNDMDISSLKQKYDGMTQNELMQELFKKVALSKSDGSFSAVQIDEFVRTVSPNLDEQSRNRLNELVAMIKSE